MQEDVRFKLIYADVAWEYDSYTSSDHGAVASQYPTMTVSEIAAIPVGEKFAHDNAIMLFWATWPHLQDAMTVIKTWGFDYVTGAPWVKTVPSSGDVRLGIGYYFQSTSECLLLCKRGKGKRRKGSKAMFGLLTSLAQDMKERVLYAPRKRHSEKPVLLYDYIEANCDGPYLELFARTTRPGWTSWGLDTGWRLTKDGVEPYVPATEIAK